MANTTTPSNTSSSNTNNSSTNSSGSTIPPTPLTTPQNPLLSLRKYSVKHILVGFSTTSDAVNTKIDYTIGKSGTVITGTGCGQKAVVIINEFTDKRFIIHSHMNEFNFHSFFDRSTTSMTGSITLSDLIGGYFQNFIRDQVATVLNVSQTHIIFALKTFFIGQDQNDTEQIITTKPLVFHMYNLAHNFNDTDKANFYTISYMADYNTYSLLPNYSKMFQMTIVHKDSTTNLSTASIPSGSSVAQTRQILNQARQQKIQNDKTMVTIQDVFDGFEKALKNMVYQPKSKLQDWMKTINTSYPTNIEPQNQQKNGGTLPMDYNIHLDPYYTNFVIDNRNLAFEQPEQSQLLPGIKSYQVKPGKFITKVVNNLMKLSSKVGLDALVTLDNQRSYKSNIGVIKTCDTKYQFDMFIKNYVVPRNDGTIDTGPGEGAVNPLQFTYQKNKMDRDIIGINMSMFSDSSLSVVQQKANSTDNRVILGNREQITVERNADTDFFQTAFSGNRAMANFKNYTLENPLPAVSIDNIVKTNLIQTSTLYLHILGNPYLLSDIFRNPIKVSTEDSDNAYYYNFPEYYPMYSYLDIYLKPVSDIGEATLKNIPQQYYYKGYYHLGKITTNITGSVFTQLLELYRTDDNT
jgi:hypothetical protein